MMVLADTPSAQGGGSAYSSSDSPPTDETASERRYKRIDDKGDAGKIAMKLRDHRLIDEYTPYSMIRIK
jgi:hypothetical protein